MSDAAYGYARTKFSRVNPWHWVLFLAVLFVVGTPLVFLVLGSLSVAELPTDFDLTALTLANYREVWLDPRTYALFTNTFIYVAGATAFGIALAGTLAWLVERTNIPGKLWIYAGVPMTLAMPGMLQAMAYVLLLSPRIGYLNELLRFVGLAPINIYSMGGMIFIEGLRLVPTAFLMLVPLLRSMDPALEEAAAMSGAKPSRTLRRVTLKVMLPGLLAIMIYQCMTALEVFEVPGVLGLPASIYVFSTKIYSLMNSSALSPAYGQADALAMIYVLLAIGATWGYAKVISRSERFTIVTGKGYRPRETKLGRMRWAAIALVLAFLSFSIILPFMVLAYVSFLPFLRSPSIAAFKTMNFAHYIDLWRTPLIGQVLMNTLYLVVITSTLTVVLSFVISLVIVRSKFWGRRILDQLSFMPHAIPGIVMGLAFLLVFLKGAKYGIDLHGGIWAISIVLAVGFMAYGTRAMNAAILQIHKDLEEAAYASGAAPWRAMWRVFYPLMLPTFVGVWVWTMLHAIRVAGAPLLLYEGSEHQVLSVLIWNMWDEGNVEGVGAIGTLMIAFLLIVTLGLRLASSKRGAAVQQSGK
jgi:iron(III) transport system permease protein